MGKIYKKREEGYVPFQGAEDNEDRRPENVVYVPIPIPVYLFCWCPPEQMSINLDFCQPV